MPYFDEDDIARIGECLEDPKNDDSDVESLLRELFEDICPGQDIRTLKHSGYLTDDHGVVIRRKDGSDVILTLQVQ